MKRPHLRAYVFTWLGLLVLLGLTLGSAYIPMGAFNSMTNLVIAVLKMLLVVIFFMHLRASVASVRVASVVALGLLAVLFALSSADYATRDIRPAPWQSQGR